MSESQRLAIEGGAPVRTEKLPYSRQCLDEADIKAVVEVFQQELITRGPKVKAFEETVARYVGSPFAVGFHTATAGLHAAMSVLDIGPGDRVAVPAITFAATANAVRYCGGELEFIDIDPETLCLDVQQLKDPGQYKAVMAVDFAGNPCDYQALKQWRGSAKTAIVSDAAHSLGAVYQNQVLGLQADLSVFSFHPVKSVTMGEGGCVVGRDLLFEKKLQRFRNHGIGDQYHQGYYDQESLGYNYHLTEMQAALGISQMAKLDSFISRRREIAKFYDEFFAEYSDKVVTPRLTSGAQSAWHLYPLRLQLDCFKVGRDEFLKALRAENIYAQIHYVPVYWHSYYQSLGYKRGLCPSAEREYQRELSLPIFPYMSDQDLCDVRDAFLKCFRAYLR